MADLTVQVGLLGSKNSKQHVREELMKALNETKETKATTRIRSSPVSDSFEVTYVGRESGEHNVTVHFNGILVNKFK